MNLKIAATTALVSVMALAGCRGEGDIVVEQGVGITALRSVCPAVGVPQFTGDMTLFAPADARTADAIDVTAAVTNVRSDCNDQGAEVQTSASFDVIATRTNASGARTVDVPYFATVLRGGDNVVAKRVGTVRISFADGQTRAQGSGTASAVVDRAEATLPEDIRRRITQRRRAGDDSAAIDPLTEPDVRAAIARATFELMIGLQLSEDQLAYNATR